VLVGLAVLQLIKYRKGRKDERNTEEEDIFDTYKSYWKTKRDSGGILGQGSLFSPTDEKIGRRANI
jgi:hypothetical protein